MDHCLIRLFGFASKVQMRCYFHRAKKDACPYKCREHCRLRFTSFENRSHGKFVETIDFNEPKIE